MGKIADVPDGGHYLVVIAQVLADGLSLSRRLDDDKLLTGGHTSPCVEPNGTLRVGIVILRITLSTPLTIHNKLFLSTLTHPSPRSPGPFHPDMVALPNNPDGVFLQGAINERKPFELQ